MSSGKTKDFIYTHFHITLDYFPNKINFLPSFPSEIYFFNPLATPHTHFANISIAIIIFQ